MKYSIDKDKRLASVFCSHADMESPEKQKELKDFIADCKSKKILVAVFESGEGNLLENTAALLKYNIEDKVIEDIALKKAQETEERQIINESNKNNSMKNKIEYEKFEPWRSMKFICKHIGCTRDTLLSWIRDKGLPAVQIGRIWRFKVSEVDAWLRSYEVNTSIGQTMM